MPAPTAPGIDLIRLLTEAGETERAERIRRFGLNPDDSIADGDPGRGHRARVTRGKVTDK